ncbi:uncharacterized protein LOC105427840 [Pogonomyrmex barbatus]|uniref:Uncharacterized protein LOC105427840 n=1 Tax=Pogonomyrmex barbatus TaxID=144034 RepID=A0A6I9X1F1_9HYME|nr:uncharacterized protein LOC105427840 [Pogonomyrmex barbatus]
MHARTHAYTRERIKEPWSKDVTAAPGSPPRFARPFRCPSRRVWAAGGEKKRKKENKKEEKEESTRRSVATGDSRYERNRDRVRSVALSSLAPCQRARRLLSLSRRAVLTTPCFPDIFLSGEPKHLSQDDDNDDGGDGDRLQPSAKFHRRSVRHENVKETHFEARRDRFFCAMGKPTGCRRAACDFGMVNVKNVKR